MAEIFDKINQVAVLANDIRFKILLALFNSDNFKINGKKLGSRSHSFSELMKIFSNIEPNDISYHLKILQSSNLVDKVKDSRGFYHITNDGKSILKKFGVTKELVQNTGNNLI